jgi:hypothetical protein
LASFGYFLRNLQEFLALPLGTVLFRIVLGSQQHVQARSSRFHQFAHAVGALPMLLAGFTARL